MRISRLSSAVVLCALCASASADRRINFDWRFRHENDIKQSGSNVEKAVRAETDDPGWEKVNLSHEVHIPVWGVYVTTPEVIDARATLNVSVEVVNKGDKPSQIRAASTCLSPKGEKVASGRSKSVTVSPGKRKWMLFDATPKYQIGTLDGKKFTPELEGTRQTIGGALKAAQCISNAPDGRAICMVWARVKPQDPLASYNQGFTLPLELSLRTATDGARCYANPVKELLVRVEGGAASIEQLKVHQLKSIWSDNIDWATHPEAR